MKHRKFDTFLNIIILLLVIVFKCVKCETSSSIPSVIRRCYARNFTPVAQPPLTLAVLLELLGKAERNTGNIIPLRLLASSMFHGIVFDGVRRNRNVSPDIDGVIPYQSFGKDFNKYKVLVDYLIPGQIELFPVGALTLHELCFLHTMLSSTVDGFERGDEIYTCKSNSYMPLIEGSPGGLSSCPLKRGVVHTNWGPVSINHVIAGIAAGLQPNQVTFRRITQFMENGGFFKRSIKFSSESENVNSVWVSTIATDVANAVLNQTTGNPVIGNEGYWNDTLLPRGYYLESHTWDMIEPDVLGGIDGVILGTYVDSWLSSLDSTRLSQILDMYYSRRGIPYGYPFKSSNRSTAFEALTKDINLERQIIGSAELLQATSSFSTYLNDNTVKAFIEEASKNFGTLAGKIATKYDRIEYLNEKELKSSIELIVILDGSYDYYEALQMISSIAEGIQVSHYVSSIGLINGKTGGWICKVTREQFQMFADLNMPPEEWPSTLSSLSQSLNSILWFYQNKTYDCVAESQPNAQTILVFSQEGRLTDYDSNESKLSLETIKASYPGTRVIFVTSEENTSLKQLLVDEDDVIIRFSRDVLSLVTQVVDKLSDLPANIVKFYCQNSQVVFEDYITPQIGRFYEIHRKYLRRGDFNTKFINNDYGDLTICAFKGDSPTDRTCKYLTVNEEISFSSANFCPQSSACSLQFEVNANNSRIKCAESVCRYPDQVRMNIRYTFTADGNQFLPSFFLIVFTNILVHNYQYRSLIQ